ncbi:MAG: 3-phosphoshikimate 1-carboxyvinyltransferase [Paludibacteraceae bacterium]|nr:3-phosphoshikimate 1-carboxyvinyltransferase [Paludibacteraceae bacterium]
MMYKITAPKRDLQDTISLPASKSISNRALIMGAVGQFDRSIRNLAKCDDTDVLVRALDSKGNHFDVGAAGTSMRFSTAYLASRPGDWHITGSERMKQRPIGVLVEALRALGAKIEYEENEGFPPLHIQGTQLKGGHIVLDGGVSSQYISAILMVAPTMKEGLILELSGNIVSVPYIRMTLGMMREMGIESEWEGNIIKVKPQQYVKSDYVVEADWSASSYWYEMAALSKQCQIQLPFLRKVSFQGDSAVRRIFEPLGISTTFEGEGVTLRRAGEAIRRMEYDFVEQPDLAQTLVVTCCALEIPFEFSGVQSLKIKETDRIAALKNECAKFGYVLTEPAEGKLAWTGERCQPAEQPIVETYEDHRMAMAFAPLAMVKGSVWVNHPMVVTKSYPEFWEHLKQVGFEIEEMN